MQEATQQQADTQTSPARYVLVTLQHNREDACVKRTGLLTGFGGKSEEMMGLESNGILSHHNLKVYAVTKVEWNLGKKSQMQFFEPTESHKPLDEHIKTKAVELLHTLFDKVTARMNLDNKGYYSANKLYANPPEHTAEEIVEPNIIITERKDKARPATTPPKSDYPDGKITTVKYNNAATGYHTPVNVYTPPQTPVQTTRTSYTSNDTPTMFRRSSTARVKARIAAVRARLEEIKESIIAAAKANKEKEKKESDESNSKGSSEPTIPEKTYRQLKDVIKGKVYSTFCSDCAKRFDCSGNLSAVYYCSDKTLESG
jgi:hypothetical protein